jgi:hypothetical protein
VGHLCYFEKSAQNKPKSAESGHPEPWQLKGYLPRFFRSRTNVAKKTSEKY